MEGTRIKEIHQIKIVCISQEAKELLQKIMEEWSIHVEQTKDLTPQYEESIYGFAYWLVRWSGLIKSA